jgi:hypothetical protein
MTSDELYAVSPEYAAWRDEFDRIAAGMFDYAFVPSTASANDSF